MKKEEIKILSVSDDPKKELEFEVAYQLSLTVVQRYKRMKKLFLQARKARKYDNTKVIEIISRS